MNTEILLGVGMFTAIIMVLVTVILMARKQLVAAGAVDIEINGDPDKTLSTAAGGKLLGTLADAGIFLSSACEVGLAVSVVAGWSRAVAQCYPQRRCILREGKPRKDGVSPVRQRSNKT